MKKPAGILALVENSMTSDRFSMTSDRFSMTSDRFSMTSDRFLAIQSEANKRLAETIYCFIYSYPTDLSIRAFRSEAAGLKKSSPGYPFLQSILINPRETKAKTQSQEFNEGGNGLAARPGLPASQARGSQQGVAGQEEGKERKRPRGGGMIPGGSPGLLCLIGLTAAAARDSHARGPWLPCEDFCTGSDPGFSRAGALA